jgi:hypothetical protein
LAACLTGCGLGLRYNHAPTLFLLCEPALGLLIGALRDRYEIVRIT